MRAKKVRICSLLATFVLTLNLLGCKEPAYQPTVADADSPAGSTDSGQVEESISETAEAADVVEAAKIVPMEKASEPEPADPPATLSVGDPAPPLNIAEWTMGKAIDHFDENQVYVVEFWATWCGPCKTSMPHMSTLQESYGDKVHFVGVTRENTSTVEKFLEKPQSEGQTWRDVIKYRLAIDEDSQTNTAYMRAAKQGGIPTAFIVGKDGVVEWIGHPMSMDQPLEQIVNDSWDRDTAVAEFKASQLIEEKSRELFSLQRAKKWDEALDVLNDLESQLGGNASLLSTRVSILQAAGRTEELAAARGKLVDAAWDNAMMLNQVAWEAAIAPNASTDDLATALKAAERANQLTDEEDGAILDTLARVYYEQGELDAAIEWQKKAAEHANGRREIRQTLQQYLDEKEEK